MCNIEFGFEYILNICIFIQTGRAVSIDSPVWAVHVTVNRLYHGTVGLSGSGLGTCVAPEYLQSFMYLNFDGNKKPFERL